MSAMDPLLTTQEAFEAMRVFLERFNEREPDERKLTIEQLLRWTERGTWDDPAMTADPAQWHDWLAAVAEVRAGSVHRRR